MDFGEAVIRYWHERRSKRRKKRSKERDSLRRGRPGQQQSSGATKASEATREASETAQASKEPDSKGSQPTKPDDRDRADKHHLSDCSAPRQKRSRPDTRVPQDLLKFAVYVERFDASETQIKVSQEDFEAVNEGLANAFFLESLELCSRLGNDCEKRLMVWDCSHFVYYCRSKEAQDYVMEVINGRLRIRGLRARYPRANTPPNAWFEIPAAMRRLDPAALIKKVLLADARIEADVVVKVITPKGKGSRTATCYLDDTHLLKLTKWGVDTGKRELRFLHESIPFRVRTLGEVSKATAWSPKEGAQQTPTMRSPVVETPEQMLPPLKDWNDSIAEEEGTETATADAVETKAPEEEDVMMKDESFDSHAALDITNQDDQAQDIVLPVSSEQPEDSEMRTAARPSSEGAQQTSPLLKLTPVVEKAPEQTTARLSSDGAQQTLPESEESSLTRPDTESAHESNSVDSRESSAIGMSKASEATQEASKVVMVSSREITNAKERKRTPACAPTRPRARDCPQRTCKSIYRRTQKLEQKQTMISDHFCVRTPSPFKSILGYSPHREWSVCEMLDANLLSRTKNPAWACSRWHYPGPPLERAPQSL